MACVSTNQHFIDKYDVQNPTAPSSKAVGFNDGCSITDAQDITFTNVGAAPVVLTLSKLLSFGQAIDIIGISIDYKQDITFLGEGQTPALSLAYSYYKDGAWQDPSIPDVIAPPRPGWTGFGDTSVLNNWSTQTAGNVPGSPTDTPIIEGVSQIVVTLTDYTNYYNGPYGHFDNADLSQHLRNLHIYALIDGEVVDLTNFCSIDPPPGLAWDGICRGGSVYVSWTALTPTIGDTITYQLYVDDAPYGVPTTDTHETITGLTVGQQYKIQVSAYECSGGGLSDPIFVTPCGECTPPVTPIGFAPVSGCHGEEAQFVWDAQPTDPDGNEVTLYLFYWCGDQAEATMLEYPGTTTGATVPLTCADLDTLCGAYLQAHSLCGDSDPTATCLFKPCCPACAWIPTVVPCTSPWKPAAKPSGTWSSAPVPTGTWKRPCGCGC